MKHGFIGLLVAVSITGSSALGQSPREQLTQMIEQLRSNPSDNALRERIIKLAQEIKPPPAVPEEARRHFVIGNTLQRDAKDAAGASLAIAEYRQALGMAPWWSDAYYNLAVAQELAGQFDDASTSLRFYLMTNPPDREARDTQDRLYALEAKKKLRQEQVSSERLKKEREAQALRTIAGEWTNSAYASNMNFVIQKIGDRYDVRWVEQGLDYKIQSATDQQFTYQLDQGLQQTYGTCTLSSDGLSLNCRSRFVQSGGSSGVHDPWSYRRIR
jgi:hypothetical protein